MVELIDLVNQIGQIGLWLKTVGIIVVLWICFQLVNFFINRRRIKEIYRIRNDMKRMEDKLDKILKKR